MRSIGGIRRQTVRALWREVMFRAALALALTLAAAQPHHAVASAQEPPHIQSAAASAPAADHPSEGMRRGANHCASVFVVVPPAMFFVAASGARMVFAHTDVLPIHGRTVDPRHPPPKVFQVL